MEMEENKKLFKITGMHCASCAMTVERCIREIDGVISANVNLLDENMKVLYDEGKISDEIIINAVRKAGFDACLFDKNIDRNKENEKIEKAFKSNKKKSFISIAFAFAVMAVSMLSMKITMPHVISPHDNPLNYAIFLLILSLPVIFLSRHYYVRGFKSLISLHPNMDSLVALSSSVSFIFSFVSTILISFDKSFVSLLYYEASVTVPAFVSLGKIIEEHNKRKIRLSLSHLNEDISVKASVIYGEKVVEIDKNALEVNDRLQLISGKIIPADSKIISGNIGVNEEMLTGEARIIEKKEGDIVYEGSTVSSGNCEALVVKCGKETQYSKIVEIAREARSSKINVEKICDKICFYFVPSVIFIALFSSLTWFFLKQDLFFSIRIFSSVLVIACPCALGLGVPTAVVMGLSLGLKNGLLVRNLMAFENAKKITDVVFDKTGTLTQGHPILSKFEITDSTLDKDEIFNILCNMENISLFPFAKYLYSLRKKDIKFEKIEEITSCGIRAEYNSHVLKFGKLHFAIENEDDIKRAENIEGHENDTIMFFSIDGRFKAYVIAQDEIRPDSKLLVNELKNKHYNLHILTGDREKEAKRIADYLSISDVRYLLMPEEKYELIKKMGGVLMIGDGINDAPSLAYSLLAMAPNTGSDIALLQADVILMKNKISDVLKFLKLSSITMRTIHRNLFFSFIYNAVLIPIACGVLYNSYSILISPSLAGIAMCLSSISVLLSSLSIKNFDIRIKK